MSSTRIRTGIMVATAAALSAGAIAVLPSLAADTGTGTTTAPPPAKGTPPPGGPQGHRGPGGPPALMLSMVAMLPDPPAGAAGPPMGPPPGGPKPGGPQGGKPAGPPPAGGKPGGPQGGTPPAMPTPAERLAMRTKHYEAIGAALGKDGAAVTAAVRGAIKTRLDQAVTDGRLTADQETQILKDWDQGGPDKPATAAHAKRARAKSAKRHAARSRARGRSAGSTMPAPPTEAERKAAVAAFRADVAKALGVSTDDLIAAITKAAPAPPTPPAGTTTG